MNGEPMLMFTLGIYMVAMQECSESIGGSAVENILAERINITVKLLPLQDRLLQA